MKNSVLILSLLITTSLFAAQDKSISAFSSSYKLESFKEYDKAIEVMKSIYHIDSYPINLRLGWLNYLKGEYTASLQYYQKAQKINPSSIEALLGSTYPLAAMYNWNELEKTYASILELDPNNKTANFRLAQIYFNRNNASKAETFLNKVITAYPFEYDTTILMAQIKTKQGKISEAKKHYNTALMLSPDDVTILKALIQLN